MESCKTFIYLRSAALGKIFCNFRNNPMVYLTHLLNVCQLLTYYLTLILNVFGMMPEKLLLLKRKGNDKLSLVF